MKPGTKLAVLSFSSVSDNFSKYVIEELTGFLVQMKRFTIVDRQSLDSIRKEMSIQLSGEVSDESAQAAGRQIGAEVIIVGSLTNLGNAYRMWIKTLKVETGQVELFYRCTIMNDSTVAFLMHGDQKSAPAASANPATGGRPQASQTPSAAPAPAAGSGVYKVGDRGPAGGIVFYDKSDSSGGWRYLEAAPKEAEFKAEWGSGISVNGTSIDVGTGKENTQLITAYITTELKQREQQYQKNGEIVKAIELAERPGTVLPPDRESGCPDEPTGVQRGPAENQMESV